MSAGAERSRAEWAQRVTGIEVADVDSAIGVPATALVRLGLRDNPRRLHLLVSQVLGKHVPTDPRIVLGAGRLLGALVDDALAAHDPFAAANGAGADDAADDSRNEAARTMQAAGAALSRALAAQRGQIVARLDPADDDASAQFDAGDDAAAQFDAAVDAALRARADRPRSSIAVLGFAETATALGHAVSDGLPGSRYLHSTRRIVPGCPPLAGFAEEHSHAPGHILLPDDPTFLAPQSAHEALVLVDDELSTGRTAANTIAALHAVAPRAIYVVAALVDVRAADGEDELGRLAARLGVRIELMALSRGAVRVPADARDRLQAVLVGASADSLFPQAETPEPAEPPEPAMPAEPVRTRRTRRARLIRLDVAPSAVRESGRHGIRPADRAAADRLVRDVAARVLPSLSGPTLVLGGEELMYAPQRIAALLAAAHDAPVRFSTTTRSPALTLDRADYPLRSTLRFRAPDAEAVLPSDAADPSVRYGYNVGDSYATVVLVLDDPCDTATLSEPGGLLDQLRACAETLVLVMLPAFRPGSALPEPLRGPHFGSYAPDEVGWLLSDLSDVRLEAPTEEREEAMQSGAAHYAESLPIEYIPSARYGEAFEVALRDGAREVAIAVGAVAGLIEDARGPDPVLVSLARAGTPVGILLRRWWMAQRAAGGPDATARAHAPVHGSVNGPAHYAVSIVRGRGIDDVALRRLAADHDPARVVFVDGWTGKGAIVRELSAALDAHRREYGAAFSAQVAVLADPGGCTTLFGTRRDVLIPSAALNSTVSGLVSRTVLNPRLLSPGAFHGAKFYRQLSDADVSARFLDAISARFDEVRDEVAQRLAQLRSADREPTWAGWAAVERISDEYGIDDVNLVKPGIGETTRVLLRRVPWRVLVDEADFAATQIDGAAIGGASDPALRHVLLLAHERGVPVEPVADLPYRCVGLIHPRFASASSGGASG